MSIFTAFKARMDIVDNWDKVPRPEPLQPGEWRSAAPMYAPQQVIVIDRGLSVGVAYLLWLLLGLVGAHYFYMGKIGMGVLYLLTLGLCGVGLFVDLFTLKGQVERENARRRRY